MNIIIDQRLNDLKLKVDALDDMFDCPVCFERLSGNVPQCSQGHHLCEACCSRLHKCPVCKRNFNGTRNYFVENMIMKFEEMKYSLNDISASSLLIAKEKKSGLCVIEEGTFPCAALNCNKSLSFCDMIRHIKRKHKNEFKDVGPIKHHKYTCSWIITHDPDTEWDEFLYIHNMGIFFVKIDISRRGKVYGHVKIANTVSNAEHFNYTLEMGDDEYVKVFSGKVVSTKVSHQKSNYLSIDNLLWNDGNGDDRPNARQDEFKVNALDDILECPVCYERLSGNVPQCTKGHHVCQKCRIRITEYPMCYSKFNGTRNYLVESIIPKFEKIKIALASLGEINVKSCTQAKKTIPTVTEAEKFPCGMEYCSKKLSYNDMIYHISNKHYKDLTEEGVINSNRYNDWWTIEHDCGTTQDKIIHIENMGIFFIKINISNKGNVYGYVLNVKPLNNTQTFYYKLKIDHPYDDDLYFDGPVVSTTVPHNKGQFLYVGDALYEDDDGDDYFDFNVKIIRVH